LDKHQKALRKFGKKVRELRKAKGWSQEHFADLAELDRSYMGAVERAEQNLTFKNISRIAATLNLSLSELFEEI
jgi:transcriptional regulator with XRE-family HTH domain